MTSSQLRERKMDFTGITDSHSTTPHEDDEIYVVLEGEGRVSVGGVEETLGPGEAAIAPAGVEHGLVNAGPAPLLVLVVVTPPPPHH